MQVKLNPQFSQSLYDSYTKLLLHGQGTNNSTYISDATGKAITAYDNAKIDTSQYKFGSSSIKLDGNDAVWAADSADFEFGTGSYTIDFWLRCSSLVDGAYVFSHINTSGGASQHSMVQYSDGSGYYRIVNSSNSEIGRYNFGAGVFVANEWHHYAIVRNGTALAIYKDGTNINATEAVALGATAMPTPDGVFAIGNALYNGSWIAGIAAWYQEFRVSKGIARWTANFTPPTAPYDDTKGKLNFPGFQEIMDFTSAGNESSVSVTVDGDTDKEYLVWCRNLNATTYPRVLLNNDSTAGHYGYQALENSAGTLTASRGTDSALCNLISTGIRVGHILTPKGFIKTSFIAGCKWSSGTTVSYYEMEWNSFNSTANITSIDFVSNSGNFTAGTRIVVYARRSNV